LLLIGTRSSASHHGAMSNSTVTVFQIPAEITEHALTFLHPLDVAQFSQTCHLAYTMVYGSADEYLWRQLFLVHPFDDPHKAIGGQNASVPYNWKKELQRRARAELVAFNIERRLDEQDFALETLISVILDAPPVQSGLEHQRSDSLRWVAHILRNSSILDAPVPSSEAKDSQLISRIRTYLSLSHDKAEDGHTTHLDALRVRSRCQVYNLRNYRRDNDYGPFLGGGHINWIHAEAMVNVIQMNLMELHGIWMDTRPPVGLEATRTYSVTGATNRASDDWACVEGTWRRYVCFMDYRYV
jgi:hypothetical protein